jgi:hypothetical protein
MATGVDLLPALAVARGAVNEIFSYLLALAKKGGIPCSAIVSYQIVREHTLSIENKIIAEAKEKGIHPPEEVPRSFAFIAACLPAETETKLKPEALAEGERYVQETRKRAQSVLNAWTKLYGSNPPFKAAVDEALTKLRVQPAIANIAMLERVYFLGGGAWPFEEARKILDLSIDKTTVTEATSVAKEALSLQTGVRDLANARGAESAALAPTKSHKWLWIGVGAAGTVAVAGTLWWYIRRRRAEANIIDSTMEPAEDILDVEPVGHLPAYEEVA